MEPTNIKPGTRLRIILESRMETDPTFSLSSTFEADADDEHFLMAAPMLRSGLFPLPIGEVLYLSYFDEKARYDFTGIVRQRLTHENLPFVQVQRTSEIVRTQRREDFRLDIILDVTIYRPRMDDKNTVRDQVIPARSIDLSGGGVALRLDQDIVPGEHVRLSLPVGDQDQDLLGEVCWNRRMPKDVDTHRYEIGVRFNYKQPRDKENIVRYIFKVQQQRLRVDEPKPLLPDRDDMFEWQER